MTNNKQQTTNPFIIITALIALIIGGGFGAWVYHPAAALQLTAPGLAEYVKFLADVRLGTITIQRLHFLLPLAVAALSLPLLVVNKQLNIHWTLNWGLRLAIMPVALVILSPIWAPAVLLNGEFRLQTIVVLVIISLAILAPLFKNLSLKWLLRVVMLATVISTSLALRQFYLTNAAIAATYANPIALGWGGWLTILGTAILTIQAIYDLRFTIDNL